MEDSTGELGEIELIEDSTGVVVREREREFGYVPDD